MAINFPSSPVNNQSYTENDQTWVYNSTYTAWFVSANTIPGNISITGDLLVTGNTTIGNNSSDTLILNGSTIILANNQNIDSGTLFIDATNNEVGIGTTNPTSNLHVIGSANITTNVVVTSLGVGTAASGVTGEIRAANNITAYYSDMRLKENIVVITDAMDKLKQISGIYYKSNDVAKSYGYRDDSEHVGVLAQDVQKVLPHVVKSAPFDTTYVDGKEISISGENYLTVQYEKLIPLLIEAIKELERKVNDLTKRT